MAIPRIATLLVLLATLNANAADGLVVAVASNFQSAAREVSAEFTEATGIPVRITSGSTGHLYAQIVNGAPYDVFLAADVERPQLLVDGELADAESLAVYATGQLVLWSNTRQRGASDCYADLIDGKFSRLAIANPETAPYGHAAKRFLQAAGIWDKVSGKLVYGENISQAFQFAATGNADLALVAESQVVAFPSSTRTCHVVLSKYNAADTQVKQAGVVLNRSRNPAEARQFLSFIVSPAMVDFLHERGY